MDLKKALNTVPHNGLLNKLFRYGIQDQPLSWFESYLRESSPPCTPWGRYCWTRLLFGISSVPEKFQQRPHDELYGLEGVVLHCAAFAKLSQDGRLLYKFLPSLS